MSVTKSAPWYQRNKYTVGNSCEQCDGVMQHESWCITRNPKVMYACEVVLDAKKLTLVDELSLHALGVAWQEDPGKGTCQQAQASPWNRTSLVAK